MNRRTFLSFLGVAPLAALPLPALPERGAPTAMTPEERAALDALAEVARYLMPDRRGYRHSLVDGEGWSLARFHDALDAIGTPKTPPPSL